MKASNDAERIVLMNAWEDYALLWQILDEVHGAMAGATRAEALHAAREAALSLSGRGLIEVFRRETRRDPFERLSAADGASALSTDAFWSGDGKDSVEIAVASTPEGDKAHETPS